MVSGEPKTFNYYLSQESTSTEVLAMMYEGLVSTDPITGDVIPKLSESWTISEDGKTIVYTLKRDLKWSDGEPLTVEDVLFTFNDIVLNEDVPTDTRDVLRIGAEGKLPTVRKTRQSSSRVQNS